MTKEDILSLQSFESESDYRESSSLNYSLLKDLVNGPAALIQEKTSQGGGALQVGSFVDKYFTAKDEFYSTYSIEKKTKLSDNIQILFERFVSEENWEPTDQDIISKCKELSLFSNIVDEVKLLSKIPESLRENLTVAKSNVGKILLNEEEYVKSMNSIKNIEDDSDSLSLITESDDVIIIPQFKIEFPILLDNGNTRMFKVMIDILRIELSTMEIKGIDIKTGKNQSHKFLDQFFDFRYDIQGSLYWMGLLAIRKAILDKFGIEFKMPSAKNFIFLYSPKYPGKLPLIMSMCDDWIKKNGNDSFEYNGVKYHGIWGLMNDADWYLINQEFSNHRIVVENRLLTISKLQDIS